MKRANVKYLRKLVAEILSTANEECEKEAYRLYGKTYDMLTPSEKKRVDYHTNPMKEAGKKEEPPADDAAAAEDGGEGEDKPQGPPPPDVKDLTINFNGSRVHQYNKAEFRSNTGIVKKITKDGMIVTTQPDQVDVLVNFDDITEIAKKFFRDKR